jgi:hypothetical protein
VSSVKNQLLFCLKKFFCSNARLVPSLRWMLRDLVVRRRMQLQKDPNAQGDVFVDVRAHFVSCVVSKLPHEEAVEMLEALIRAARPVASLVCEIAVPALNAVVAYAKSGKLLVWRAAQWTAWKGLVARIMQQGLSLSVSATPAQPEVSVTLDAEDPNSVLAGACAPLGELAGRLLLQRLDPASCSKVFRFFFVRFSHLCLFSCLQEMIHESLVAALKSKQVAACAEELLALLRREAEPSGAKRGLAFSDSPVASPSLIQFDPPNSLVQQVLLFFCFFVSLFTKIFSRTWLLSHRLLLRLLLSLR